MAHSAFERSASGGPATHTQLVATRRCTATSTLTADPLRTDAAHVSGLSNILERPLESGPN